MASFNAGCKFGYYNINKNISEALANKPLDCNYIQPSQTVDEFRQLTPFDLNLSRKKESQCAMNKYLPRASEKITRTKHIHIESGRSSNCHNAIFINFIIFFENGTLGDTNG